MEPKSDEKLLELISAALPQCDEAKETREEKMRYRRSKRIGDQVMEVLARSGSITWWDWLYLHTALGDRLMGSSKCEMMIEFCLAKRQNSPADQPEEKENSDNEEFIRRLKMVHSLEPCRTILRSGPRKGEECGQRKCKHKRD